MRSSVGHTKQLHDSVVVAVIVMKNNNDWIVMTIFMVYICEAVACCCTVFSDEITFVSIFNEVPMMSISHDEPMRVLHSAADLQKWASRVLCFNHPNFQGIHFFLLLETLSTDTSTGRGYRYWQTCSIQLYGVLYKCHKSKVGLQKQ